MEPAAKKRAVSAEERSAALAALKLACGMPVAGNKAAAAAAGSSMEPAAKEEDKREQADGISTIRLPDWFIKRIQTHRLRRASPLPEGFLDHNPKLRERLLASKPGIDAFVDLEEDILGQLDDKGYAEVGMEVVDGVTKLCILPKPDLDQTEDL